MTDVFKRKVEEQIERLRRQSYRSIEDEVTRKRLAWFEQRPPEQQTPVSPRRAYEVLFGEYMGLALADLPVVRETQDEIVWRSQNPCPTLAACQTLGLDTRRVCRAAYEKSTQAFVSQLDPQLRFLRSYEEIRPYAGYCLERIVRVDFAARMALAVEEARVSRQGGNKGYGAVVVRGERVLGLAHDTAVSERDPSLHAEVNAIRQAVRAAGEADLSGAILFSTCEPCPMCSSLAVWANLTSIVYGVSIAETAVLGKARIQVEARQIVARSPVMIEVIGGVLAETCRGLYE